METELYTVEAVSEGIYKEKGSKFIAFLSPARDRATIDAALADVRKKYYDARHVCYAYRIGAENRAIDDGEPAHSAGAPILREIISANLDGVIIAVVRYFGGIKLGVPGLIRAYSTAAADAIANGVLLPYFESVEIELEIDYPQTQRLKYLQKRFEFEIVSQIYAERCRFRLRAKKKIADELTTELENSLSCETIFV